MLQHAKQVLALVPRGNPDSHPKALPDSHPFQARRLVAVGCLRRTRGGPRQLWAQKGKERPRRSASEGARQPKPVKRGSTAEEDGPFDPCFHKPNVQTAHLACAANRRYIPEPQTAGSPILGMTRGNKPPQRLWQLSCPHWAKSTLNTHRSISAQDSVSGLFMRD